MRNNLFVTTKALREYHYNKHRKNAFYHIQAINLPFQNIEFYWYSSRRPVAPSPDDNTDRGETQ